MKFKIETEEQLNEQIYMEVNEQIFRDVAFSLNFDDDVYQQPFSLYMVV